VPSVPPLPTLLVSLLPNELLIALSGLENLLPPARRPKPMPAVALIGPTFFVATTYSELYHPVPIKSLRPILTDGL
jgi:hypothetical protein